MSTVPAETIATIRTMRAKGHSIREICDAVGHAPSCVYRYSKGIKPPFGPRKSGPRRKVAKAICFRLREQGLTYRAIAARLGVAHSAVHKALNGRPA